MMTVSQIEKEIEGEISKFNGDIEGITFYLITLGQRNLGMVPSDKTDQNLVRGCQTKVWFKAFIQDSRVYLTVDSNTIISRGLGSLLARLFNGQKPEDILKADLQCFQRDDFNSFMGSQRSNGLNHMIHHVRIIVTQLMQVC
jgi:cysteine desulfuration protein SufE